MATKKAAPKASSTLKFPKNLGVTGILSFPIWNEQDRDVRLPEWRTRKGFKKGRYPDRIGGQLHLTQSEVDKVQKYLLEDFLPFTAEQYEHTKGEKGFDADQIAELTDLISAENWDHTNGFVLPLRHLTDKDQENAGDDIVAKFTFNGSGGKEISKDKVLIRPEADGGLMIQDLDAYSDEHPVGDRDSLFWGARNTFRGAFNLNAYTNSSVGIAAYTRGLYLRTDLNPTWGGGSDDETVLEEDFE